MFDLSRGQVNLSESSASFSTESGIPIEPFYMPSSKDSIYETNLGDPGEFPYTRGIHPTMYRGRLWTMRQYAGYSTPEESNARYKHLLAQGQNGLSVAFDLPTQIGYDSDHEMASGEVGKVGVPICTLEDMGELFRDIPLDTITASMTINATAPVLLAMYLGVARKQGVSLDQVGGTVQNDILKEYIARGTYAFPPEQSLRLTTDLISYCTDHVPNWNTISVSGYHMRESGATAPQELAFTLANGIAYVEAAIGAGLNVDDFAGRLSFFFVAHNNLFEEAAKFRAARRMWAHIMKDHFGAKNPRSWMLRFHTQTAGVTLTAQQAENNVVRTTIQALSAILGGTQSLHVNAKDEALALPTEESATLALRTQQILANESGVSDSVDPLAGSYYVEQLTDSLESRAKIYLDTIKGMGGAVAAIRSGFQKKEIEDAAYNHLQSVESGNKIVVGVNAYENDDSEVQETLKIDPEQSKRQLARLKRVKEDRDMSQVELTLNHLHEAAMSSGVNTMPVILECVEAYATLGEICDVLRTAFGAYVQENNR